MWKNDDLLKIEKAIEKFLHWHHDFGNLSYDQFDFWGSKLGVFSKRLFYKNKILAAPLVVLLQVLESFMPRTRVLFAPKRRFAIGDAHLAMGYMNLYEYTSVSDGPPKAFDKGDKNPLIEILGRSRAVGDRTLLRHLPSLTLLNNSTYSTKSQKGSWSPKAKLYLNLAKALLEELESTATRTSSGMGWGYPYTWVTSKAVYPPGTPFITVTPYVADAFLKMHGLTGEKKYLDIVAQIARFAAFDLKETVISADEVAAGYGIGDDNAVYNANAYRAVLLLEAHRLFDIAQYKEKAVKNIAYVLNRQQPDGSWHYAADQPFIDNFHTCFVLKNLYKAYLLLKDDLTGTGKTRTESILRAVKKGYEYYRRYLFRPDRTPIHFARSTSPKFRKMEMYDYAEGISLGPLLNPDMEGALDFSMELARDLIDSFQLKDGHFVTRVTTLNTRNKIPYLRWPQAQLFYALTTLLLTGPGSRFPGDLQGCVKIAKNEDFRAGTETCPNESL